MPALALPPTQGREVHLRKLLEVLYFGRYLALSILALVVSVTAVYVFTRTPIYKGTAIVNVTTNTVQPIGNINPFNSYGFYESERYFNAQIEVLKSRELIKFFLNRPELAGDPEIQKAKDPIGLVASRLRLDPDKNASMIRISMLHPDKDKAALWANSYVDAYVAYNMETAVNFLHTAHDEIIRQIESYQVQYENKMRDLVSKQTKGSDGSVTGTTKQVLEDRIGELEAKLTSIRVAKIEKEGFLSAVSSGNLEAIPGAQDRATVNQLSIQRSELERELQTLSQQFTPQYPAVEKKRKELASVTAKINQEIGNMVAAARGELAGLNQQEADITREIETARQEALRFQEQQTGIEPVRLATEAIQAFLATLTDKAQQINLSAAFLNNNIRVVDYSMVPRSPFFPRRQMSIILSVLVGLVLGVGVTFFVDYMDNTVKTAEDVEQGLGINLLTMVPRYREETAKAVKEAFQTLRTSLIFASKARALRLVLCTSPGPGEGKSSTIVHLAKVLAGSGERVLLIDCDLRKPTIHKHFGLNPGNGLTKFLAARQDVPWRDFVTNTSFPNLTVLLAGPIPPNPPELFGLDRFKELLADAKQEYDWVLLDSPPLLSITDSSILAALVDLVVLVLRHGKTDIALVKRSVGMLKALDAHLVGAALNDVDPEKSYYQEYYFMSNYYYGSEQPKPKGLGKVAGKIKESIVNTR